MRGPVHETEAPYLFGIAKKVPEGFVMPLSEWTRMAIASGVAVIAISYLAIDAVVDVNAGGIEKRIEVAQASITNAVANHYQRALAVQAWARGSDQKHRSAADQTCVQGHAHGPQSVDVDRGV